LAAQQGLELIDDAVVKVRQLMIKIKNSVVISDELRKLCQCAKINYLKPELDVKTRWNSTFNMLKKMERIWNGVRMLAVRNQEVRMLMPTEADWRIIEVCFSCNDKKNRDLRVVFKKLLSNIILFSCFKYYFFIKIF
jgi:hypothetical protein